LDQAPGANNVHPEEMRADNPLLALTREVSPRLAECELTHLTRQPIDIARAKEQHLAYEELLRTLGCTVRRLPAEPELPDSVFVEDMAVVLDELAIITRPGAESRRPELDSVALALRGHRKLERIHDPGTLDGGDVLVAGRTIYIGLSRRTNDNAVAQVRSLVEPLGYQVRAVAVRECLHLKSAVGQVANDTLLYNPAWIDASVFEGMRLIEVDPTEPHAANALWLGHAVVYPAAYEATRKRLEKHGIPLRTVDLSELAKAEGAVTCCSLVFRAIRDLT
jgi:dimethylargininase